MASELRPIGIFDSGLGGLTVLKALRQKYPHENFVYLGDTARLPYGSKSTQTIRRYLQQNINYLSQLPVKALVVACNSASSVLSLHDELPFPIYSVIDPGAAKALAQSKNHRIGVIGTRATVAGQAYTKAIHALNPEVQVFQQACPLLVPLVEEGWDDDPLTNLVIYRYLSPLMDTGMDTLILGCTHYPILKSAIAKVTGSGVALVDSAECIATRLEQDFAKSKVKPNPQTTPGQLKILTTDHPAGFEQIAQRILAPFTDFAVDLIDL